MRAAVRWGRALVALAVLGLGASGCASGRSGRLYDNGDLRLLTAYRAKELCSCLFVVGQTEDFCRAWTRASPNLAGFTVDRERKTVRTSALLFWRGGAHWVDERFGCVLDR